MGRFTREFKQEGAAPSIVTKADCVLAIDERGGVAARSVTGLWEMEEKYVSIRPRLRSDESTICPWPEGARWRPRVAGEMGGSSDRLPRSETGHRTRGTANHSPHPSLGSM